MQVSPSLTSPLGQKQPGKQTPLWKVVGEGWIGITCNGGQEDWPDRMEVQVCSQL